MISEYMKIRLILPLLAAAVLLLVVCGGQTLESPTPAPTAIPNTPTPLALSPTPLPTPTAPPASPTPPPPAQTPTAVPAPPAQAATAVPAPPSQATDTLFEEKTFSFLKHLTAEFSPRESATDQELAAALFLRNRMTELGYNVSIQDFDVTMLLTDTALMSNVEFSPGSEDPYRFHAFAMTGSSEGTKVGTLADVGRAFEGDIPSEGLDGRVALIERGEITFQEKVGRVAEAGAVAAIVFNNVQGEFGGRLLDRSTIPAVSIARADGLRLLDLMEQGETKVAVSVEPISLPSRNVIAEKPGQSESGGVVVVGAHYDTTPDTQGANDNGSGLSVVMTIAELTADTAYPFTIRFVLFGAEEIGLFGSRHYVDALTEREIADSVAMLNFDVPGSGDRLDLIGSPELTAHATQIAAEIGAVVSRGRLPEGADSDHAPFNDAGIPVIFVLGDDLSRINSPADDIQWINPTLMGWTAEIGIQLLDRLAQDSEK